ncbi:hypothetical protein Cni_G20248 [Canna indica]|uniref:Uncharacterized protein n=1 Tax=Canna indica TaxID=4628 RepID=A0AAQ3KMS7_9LILI|nr:hypothetical protein Cni_G20248 [Canna indica]
MVELSRTCNDVDFLLVIGYESEQTQELCRREVIESVPHFTFYMSMEKVHEEEGIRPDQLVGDVLYYSDNHSKVVQLHSRADMEALIDKHRGADSMLVVLDVGLKHCGPCVKVLDGKLVFEVTERIGRGFASRWGRSRTPSLKHFLRFQAPCILSNDLEFVDKKG